MLASRIVVWPGCEPRTSRPESQSVNHYATEPQNCSLTYTWFSCCAPPFGTVFPHLYTLLTVSLVLGLSSRLICSPGIYIRSAVRASDTLTRSFMRYKFVTYFVLCYAFGRFLSLDRVCGTVFRSTSVYWILLFSNSVER